MNAFKELVEPRKGDYVQRSDDTTLLTLHVLNFRNDLQITGHVQSSTFLTDDTEVFHELCPLFWCYAWVLPRCSSCAQHPCAGCPAETEQQSSVLFAYPALSWASSYFHSSSYHHSSLWPAGHCARTDDAQGVGAADHAAGDARVPPAGPSGIPSFCVSGLWKGLSEVQESVTEYIIMSDLDTAMSARLISLRC